MVLMSAMQSGVTDNLINALRLSLGVARRTLQRWWRWWHWWREIFVGTPCWTLGSGRFMPPVEHAALPDSLLERLGGMDARSQLVRCLNFWHHFQNLAVSPTMMVAEHPQRMSQPRDALRR